MQAWTTAGQPETHPEPWGRPGAFTTFRVFAGHKTPFLDQYLDRLLDSAKRLQLPWLPPLDEIDNRTSAYLDELSNEFSGLVRICLFEDLLGISNRSAISDGNPVEGWLIHHRRPEPLAKSLSLIHISEPTRPY